MKYFCPVCGYPELDEPPYFENEAGSFEICPCCFIEFGFTEGGRDGDALRDWIAEYRSAWVAQGMPWRSESRYSQPPRDWDPSVQILNVKQDKGPALGTRRYEYRHEGD